MAKVATFYDVPGRRWQCDTKVRVQTVETVLLCLSVFLSVFLCGCLFYLVTRERVGANQLFFWVHSGRGLSISLRSITTRYCFHVDVDFDDVDDDDSTSRVPTTPLRTSLHVTSSVDAFSFRAPNIFWPRLPSFTLSSLRWCLWRCAWPRRHVASATTRCSCEKNMELPACTTSVGLDLT